MYTKAQLNILNFLENKYAIDIETLKSEATSKIVIDEDGDIIYFEKQNGTLTEKTPCEKGDFDAILDKLAAENPRTDAFYGRIHSIIDEYYSEGSSFIADRQAYYDVNGSLSGFNHY